MQHEKDTVSVFYRRTIRLRIAGLLQTWSKVEVHIMNWFLHVNGIAVVEIHWHLVMVQCFWYWLEGIWRQAADRTSSTSTTDGNVCLAGALIRGDGRVFLIA